MKFREYNIQHPFHLTQFLIPKVGAVVVLEEGETRESAAKRMFEEMLWLEQEYKKFLSASVEVVDRNPPLPVQQVAAPKAVVDKEGGVTLEEQIRSCLSLNVLGIYEPIIERQKDAKEKTRLWLVYDEVYAQLTQTETVAT